MLIFYIGAEDNSTDLGNKSLNPEVNVPAQTDTNENVSPEVFYENIDAVNGGNGSNISLEEEEENISSENLSLINENLSNETIPGETSGENKNTNTDTNTNLTEENVSRENPSSGGSSEGSSGGSSGSSTEYVNLNEINPNLDNSQESSEKEKISYTYYTLGKKEIEIENYEEINLVKNELEKNEFEKEVSISSEEHFEGYLRVYTSLTTQSKKEDIKIYWKNNENLEITEKEEYSVEYYDEDNNGLIDRVSWIVPHLSEQVFEIVITFEKTSGSENISLDIVNPPNGIANNPIPFDIHVDYSGEVNCYLKINTSPESIENFANNHSYSLTLPNGYYVWMVNCSNLSENIYNFIEGNFTVNEGFSVSLTEGKVYFLDLTDDTIKNPETININSTNPSNFTVKLNNQIISTKNLSVSTTLVMNSTLLNSYGNYNLSVEFDAPSSKTTIIKNFSVVSGNLILTQTTIDKDEQAGIRAIIYPINQVNYYQLIFDEGHNTPEIFAGSSNIDQMFYQEYQNTGTKIIKLNISLKNDGNFIIQKTLTVTDNTDNSEDTSPPSITLIEPDDEEIIHGDSVNFTYKASDNVKVENCSFKLYENCASMSSCSTSSSNLVFPLNSQQRAVANVDSVENNEKIEVKLEAFDDGIYMWQVECYDNSSNYDWNLGFFEISVNGTSLSLSSSSSYDQEEEVESLMEQADDFLTTNFGLDEKEVLDDLNILNDTKYYKKRLTDIDNFFSENYKYVSTQSLLNAKTDDYLAELENIKNNMPQNIVMKGTYEYIKNSVDSDLEGIVQDYFDSTNTKIGKSSVKKLAETNRKLQNEISVSANIKDVEVEYGNRTEEITLVKKEITLNNESYNKLLEVIPKNIAENSEDVVFLTKNEVINEDPLFEINYEDLDKKEILYYIRGAVKLKDFEGTETLLFEEDLNKLGVGFTGFFIVDFSSGSSALYIVLAFILLIVLSFMAVFVFKKFKMVRWRKEPNVVRMMDLIEGIKKLLKEREIEKARENYYKIKAIYPVLPYKTRPYFYKKVNEMLVRIDKKDILGLVKEYQEAKRNWNKEDYMRLYEDIKKIYKRLPEKDRKKVYDIINGY